MKIKIDTKEKFTVLTPEESFISANMTEDIESICGNASYKIPHIVVNMKMVEIIDEQAAEKFSQIQQQFYEKNKSMVICELQKEVEKVFVKLELIDFMNITPTESEAWDILQMEEIERELLNDFDAEDK
jgi:anti-anti-sigma regulatory factor